MLVVKGFVIFDSCIVLAGGIVVIFDSFIVLAGGIVVLLFGCMVLAGGIVVLLFGCILVFLLLRDTRLDLSNDNLSLFRLLSSSIVSLILFSNDLFPR